MKTSPRLYNLPARQRGFSLVELLVAMAINLVIVAAAAYMYLGTSDTRKAMDERQAMTENGQLALDLIGRDIVNAGFYPTIRPATPPASSETPVVNPDAYFNPVPGTPVAFNTGVFGCTNQRFNRATSACAAHAATTPADAIVINYFTNDAMGANIGHRTDCTGSQVTSATNATENNGRYDGNPASPTYSGAAEGLVPLAPLFVSNRYTLQATTISIEEQSISTFSLACNGNANTAYQPVVLGIEQLQFRYGVFTDATTLQPARFYRSDAMAALGNVKVNGVNRNAWSRVVAVEVCLVARGLRPSKLQNNAGNTGTYVDCNGTTITPSDRVNRRVYRKVFALRNNLTQTIIPN